MPNPRRWWNLGLVGALLTLAGVILIDPQPRVAAPLARVSALDTNGVTQVAFHSPPADPVHLERRQESWWLAAPVALPANPIKVSTLLSLPAAASLSRFLAAGSDLAQFGLDQPQAELTTAGQRFALGNTEPLDGRRYVLHDGQIHLVQDAYFQFINAGPATFVDPAPLATATRVTGIELPGGHMRWTGQRWEVAGLGAPSPDWLNQAAASWLRTQAVMVRPLVTPDRFQQAVVFQLEGPEPEIAFTMRATTHEIILARPRLGLQYHLLRSAIEPLLRGPTPATGPPAQEAAAN